LTSKDVEKHPNATGVVKLIEYCDLVRKRARHEAHWPSYLQMASELHNAARVGRRD